MPDTHGLSLLATVSPAEVEDELWLELSRHRPAPATPRPVAPPPRHAVACALPALLALDGEAFIHSAYATVLGRPADEAGVAALTAALARGCDKVALLRTLQRSPEGRTGRRAVPGLRRAALLRRLDRVPVAGPLARAAAARLPAPAARPAGVDPMLAARLAALEAQVAAATPAMAARMDDQQLVADALTRRVSALLGSHDALARTVLGAVAEQREALAALAGQYGRVARQVADLEHANAAAILAVADGVAALHRRLAALEDVFDAQAAADRIDRAAGAVRAELDRRLLDAAAEARQRAADGERRLGLVLSALGEGAPPAAADHALDALYLQFEDRFRGRRDDIKQRQRVHLPRLRACGAGLAARPVLDVGAGRGEFLELLREEGLAGQGVDSNGAMVAACRRAGLPCAEGDALAFLAALPDASLGAVTGFHIVEHLPFPAVVRIMDEALRALAPGGLLLLETPNPANLLTASRFFYLDPTHRNPLPGEMLAAIAEARGFAAAEIVPLHPMSQRFPGADRELASALDAIFHGPQDYALVARRPAAGG